MVEEAAGLKSRQVECGYEILRRAPQPAIRLNPALPPGLDQIINKALEKDPDLRYQNAAEIQADLHLLKRDSETSTVTFKRKGPGAAAPWIALSILLAIALMAGLYQRARRQNNRLTGKDTVVLADFANSTGDGVFDDTLKTALNVSLRQSPFLSVLPDQQGPPCACPARSRQSLKRDLHRIVQQDAIPTLTRGLRGIACPLIDSFLGFRYRTDFRNSSFDQAVLCDFVVDGHLERHLRRMRNLYAERLATLMEGAKQHLGGLLEISNVRAGLYTIGYLKNEMTSRQAEKLAAAQGVEVLAVDRCTLRRPDPNALLLGFGGFDEVAIRQGLIRLAKAFS